MKLYWKTAMKAVMLVSLAGLAVAYLTYVLVLSYNIASI